jgi:hypothetical protein
MSAIEDFRQHPEFVRRTASVRASNDHIAMRAEALHFTSRVPLLCECDDPRCRELVLVSLDDFRRLRLTGEALVTPEHAPFGGSA